MKLCVMKALVIEDEQISFRKLKRMLLELRPDMEIDGPLTTTREVVSRLSEFHGYDLIFSDIRLREGEVFEAFNTVMPDSMVVFITAYDEYAIKAFKNNGVDYLLKPIDKSELSAALDKVESFAGDRKLVTGRINGVVGDLRPYRERILVWKGECLIPINVNDVSYFYFGSRHVSAKLADGSSFDVRFTMSELECELDPKKFFRLNRQYITNVDSIVRISQFFGSRLSVSLAGCDESLILSKDKSTELRDWLDR